MNDLMTNVRTALAGRKASLATIANESGVGLQWLLKFHQGHIRNPGILRLQKLHDYFARSQK